MNILDPQVRNLHRLLVGKATRAKISDDDQILLPAEEIVKNNFGGSVVLVGQGSYIEIWSIDQWSIEQKNSEKFAFSSGNQIDLSL